MNRECPVGSSAGPRFSLSDQGSRANSPTTHKNKSSGKNQHGEAGRQRRRYVTRARVEAVQNALNDRQRAVLADVARVRLLSGQHVLRLHYGNSEADRRQALRDLTRLLDYGALARLERRIGGVRGGSAGYVYALDVLGQRLLEPQPGRYRSPWTPEPGHLAHGLGAAELYVELRERSRVGHVQLLDYCTEPRCWRRFVGPGGRSLFLKPDAQAVCANATYEDRYFIEIDRSTESLPRIVEKAQLYVGYWQSGQEQHRTGVFPRVLWVAPDDQRRERLVEALSSLDSEHWPLFGVTTSDQAAARITGGLEADGASA